MLLFLIRKNFQSRLSSAKPFLFVGELMKQYKGRVVAEEMNFSQVQCQGNKNVVADWAYDDAVQVRAVLLLRVQPVAHCEEVSIFRQKNLN